MSSAIYLRSSPSRFPRFPAEEYTSISNLSLPLKFDWRDKHVITQVRNQKTVCLRFFFFLFNHFRMGVTFGVKFNQTCDGTILSVGKFTPRSSQNDETRRPPPPIPRREEALLGPASLGRALRVSLPACLTPTQHADSGLLPGFTVPRTLQNSGWKAEGGELDQVK